MYVPVNQAALEPLVERRWRWLLCGLRSELLGPWVDCRDRDTFCSPTTGPVEHIQQKGYIR